MVEEVWWWWWWWWWLFGWWSEAVNAGVFVRGSRGTREECRFAPEEVWRRRTRDRVKEIK